MGIALRYLSLVLLFAAFGVLSTGISDAASDSREEILVGRIAHVEGKLLRYIEEDKDWVLTVRDSPFGLEDALYSGVDGKAEFIMPNRTWIRVGENTQIQLIDLYSDATTVDVASGLARLYNNSDDVVIKATTPFGYVVAPGGTIFDLYVGDESIEVIAVRGNVDFVHDGSRIRYQIQEGSSSIIADAKDVASGNGAVDSVWDDWNGKRDYVWLQRLQRSEYSAQFLPEPIRDEAYVLEENGKWERVNYEGEYVHMWRPTRVSREWRPFTTGRWTVYYGDNCWIPDESFGYVTHHYGSWFYLESARAWYWMPPVAHYTQDTPEFFIGFGWYPGRVGWIHSGPSIGWVPLAPYESYYGYRSWGHRTVVISHTTIINITDFRYRYLDEAVIIDRDYFYRGSRYTPHVRRDIGRDIIINTYQPVTVINNTVINNFNTDKRRFAYNDERVSRKPHATVINRISDNRESSRKSGRINRDRIERDLTRFDARSEPLQEREVRRPMLTTKLVDASQVSRPIDTLSLQKKEIKPRARERQIFSDKGHPGRRVVQERLEQARESVKQEEQRRIRSPRESRSEGPEQVIRRPDQDPKVEDNQGGREPQIRRQQVKEGQGPQRRPVGDDRESQEQRRQAAEKVKEEIQAERQQGERQRVQRPEDVDAEPRIRSPREKGNQETEQRPGRQGQVRQQDESQGQNEQQIRRQQQEESQRLQKQENQQRQQVENQRRQEQEVRKQQQEGAQRQQAQENQQRQQVENQRRQEQELRKQQQEGARRQQAQENQQRQQVENQRRQEQELRKQQQERVQGPQVQQQSEKKGKRTSQEQEEWEEQQKNETGQGKQRSGKN
jgi:hypothetical protein